jgi:hypothetical protein
MSFASNVFSARFGRKDGVRADWVCSKCEHENPGYMRSHCRECGAKRDEK